MEYLINVYYDKETMIYRYKSSGKKVNKKALYQAHLKKITEFNKYTDKLTNDLASQKINFTDYQKNIITQLKDLKIYSLELAKGGKENTYAIDYLTQARQLKNFDYPSLQKLFREIANGEHSEKMIKSRLRSFARSSRQAFEDGIQSVNEAEGKQFMKRKLTATDNCPECVEYANAGVVKLGELPLPTEQCTCRFNCRCIALYGTLEELINA